MGNVAVAVGYILTVCAGILIWTKIEEKKEKSKEIPPGILYWVIVRHSLGIQKNGDGFHHGHDHIWGLCENSDFRYIRFI